MSDTAILLALALSLLLAVGAAKPHQPASPALPAAASSWANDGFTLPASCPIEPQPEPSLSARND